MFVKVHRQVDTICNNTPSASAQAAVHSTTATSREQTARNGKKNAGFIPRRVLSIYQVNWIQQQMKRDGSVCDSYLISCAREDDDCPNDRAHFVPKKLPDIVKAEINKRFGGLKTEHKRL
ncbi:unnamed protein product [Phytophthora lilii]|uniref:Unnamed protein product n=1 Tax=Phytophthora lilii TaxID=2077276 RepID=A0A9W6WYW7_9STRA|nr:unnamed protein product [Phytophthora lilii]